MSFCVCALFYGDRPDLARRLLGSLPVASDFPDFVQEIRLGLNEVSNRTREAIADFVDRCPSVPIRAYEPERNVGKYPLLRRMLFDEEKPIVAPRLMWWDDDSWIARPSANWWSLAYAASEGVVQVGQRWWMPMRGSQHLAVQSQPWYREKEVKHGHRMEFATGGWWIADPEFLRRWDYPFPELHHNGGDSMFGELCRQLDAPRRWWWEGLGINGRTSYRDREEPRRGISQSNLWFVYDPARSPSLDHQRFSCRVVDL